MFHPWVEKIPWRRKRLPAPVFLPGESHGQRTLAGYSPWGHKESDMAEYLNLRRRKTWDPLRKNLGEMPLKLLSYHPFSFPLLSLDWLWYFPAAVQSHPKKKMLKCQPVLVAQLCPVLSNPWTVAHQAPLSMEFSRQECQHEFYHLPLYYTMSVLNTNIRMFNLQAASLT